eukprot:TRINITY_DN2272_c0_g1_i1.p2 TRINITY_DN2272_c0_g1~~TRINITY_DN2272_c0_g1_i1.p2  ORF type:complete len:1699 (-),score=191.91 TRINITY_DN2272_c0_g1_i1:6805-11901(-)
MITGKNEEKFESPSSINMPMYYKDNWSSDKKSGKIFKEISPIKVDTPLPTVHMLHKIMLHGLASQHIPPASYAIPLLNFVPAFEKVDPEAKREIEYMLALSLISGRRFVQACEILRKIETSLLTTESTLSPRIVLPPHLRAARIEILIAESMNPHFQLHEKLKAFKRATDLALGGKVLATSISPPAKYSSEDIYTFLTRIHPHLVKLLLSLLTDKHEGVRMAAIKSLDFVIENMGCSLGTYVVPILKTILSTFPGNSLVIPGESPSKLEISPSLTFPESSPRIPKRPAEPTDLISIASLQAEKFTTQYSHLLETYGSVLGSVSSQLLHKIFYDIILPITYSIELSPDLRSVLLTIGERIITICQGDLVPTSDFLNGVVKDQNSANDKLATAAQNLWQIIKSKLCPNCDKKGRKRIVQWIIENLVAIAEKMNGNLASRETAEEDAALKVGTYVDIANVLLEDKQEQEAANPLVVRTGNNKTDYYELINPLLYWLNFSMSSEERIELFGKIWRCVANLMKSMKETIGFDPSPLIGPLLEKLNEHCKYNSPTVPMLKFLETVLADFQEFSLDVSKTLVSLLEGLSSKLPNYPFEDIFIAFDLLCEIALKDLNGPALKNVILGLTDRYTSKCKKQQESIQKVIKKVLSCSIEQAKEEPIESTFFGVVTQFCIKENKDVDPRILSNKDPKKPLQIHDTFVGKLNFVLEVVKSLNKTHIKLYQHLVSLKGIEDFLSETLGNGHSSIRLKIFEFLDTLCNYFIRFAVKEKEEHKEGIEVVIKEQFLLAKYVLGVAKKSMSNPSDSYMQFNSLILLDLVFQHILPVPSFEAEVRKKRQRVSPSKVARVDLLDLEALDPKNLPLTMSVTDLKYLHIRLMAGLKVWPYIKLALNSPWSNIRSVSYGLICSLAKIDTNDYRSSFKDKLKSALLPLLITLLSSKESESKAGGLNILGSFMGLGYDVSDFKISTRLNFFKRNAEFVSLAIWQQVFDLQEDWDGTIKEAASVLIQLAAPRESVVHFWRIKAESEKLKLNCLAGKYGNLCMTAANRLLSLNTDRKSIENDASSVLELLDMMGRTSDLQGNEITYDESASLFTNKDPMLNESANSALECQEQSEDDIFQIEKYSDEQIKEIISIFKNDFKPPKNLWIESRFSDTLVQEQEQMPEFPTIEDVGKIIQPEKLVEDNGKPKPKYQMIDILEDKLVGNLPENKVPHAEVKVEEEKAPKKPDTLDAEPYRFLPADEDINQDDLEIIELAEGEEDFLGKLESDNVPVLKNTYADKRNKRPTAPRPRGKITKVKIDLNQSPNVAKKEEVKKDLAVVQMPLKAPLVEETKVPEKKVEKTPLVEEAKIKNQEVEAKVEEKVENAKLPPLPPINAKPISNPSLKPEKDHKAPQTSPVKLSDKPEPVVKPSPTASKRKPRVKPNNSLVVPPKRPNKKPRPSNKSFEHNTTRSSSRPMAASRSGVKYIQASSPSKVITNLLATQTVTKRRKVHSTRVKQETTSSGQKSQKRPRKGGNSSSLPATPRIELAKTMANPGSLLKDVKFRSKRKEKHHHHKRQPQQNFAKTSPALAAILKSLRPSTCKAGDDSLLRSYRTNFVVGTFAQEEEKEPKRPMRVKFKKPVEKPKGDLGWHVPVQAINITTDQISFKPDNRPQAPLMNNYVDVDEASNEINQTYQLCKFFCSLCSACYYSELSFPYLFIIHKCM